MYLLGYVRSLNGLIISDAIMSLPDWRGDSIQMPMNRVVEIEDLSPKF